MAEYVRPARQYDQSGKLTSGPDDRRPRFYPSDPTPAGAGKSGYSLPLTAGRTLGRLFIGLADNAPMDAPAGSNLNGMPAKPYFNSYEEPRVNNKDNRYTL